ncbi:hypothetical protein [Corynebacterium vitaeruminis]|uniref:Membrane protein n=1 Tax=Corynebacterium vitaeruminis DSM 20294 TaxID=1224164 RepID=W5XY98_9CORY|nr:hypothetical protein [Corynebacterium vitaeruminis]AHI21986.1 membrane protein [Corynebacterium vitaeruminis DSM 20294]
MKDQTPGESQRRKLQRDSILGFLATLAFLAVAQAVVNLFLPEPRVWPALLALVLVVATVAFWRWSRRQ